jgi:hypothetical protein
VTSSVSTARCRRTHGQNPRVLMVGAAESAPYEGDARYAVLARGSSLRTCAATIRFTLRTML